jgi:hypothetical protein
MPVRTDAGVATAAAAAAASARVDSVSLPAGDAQDLCLVRCWSAVDCPGRSAAAATVDMCALHACLPACLLRKCSCAAAHMMMGGCVGTCSVGVRATFGSFDAEVAGRCVATDPLTADRDLANAHTLSGGAVGLRSGGGFVKEAVSDVFVCAAVAVAVRGGCPFVEKVRRLVAAGAVAVIIVNTSDEKFFRIEGHRHGDGFADLGHGIRWVV